MSILIDVLIPTYDRPEALAVTLTSLAAQTYDRFRVVVADQSEKAEAAENGVVQAAARVLRAHGCPVEFHRRLERYGMAEQRQFLLDQANTPYALFLDDDLILEPWVIEQMAGSIIKEGCGFVGSAVIGLSFIDDVRPHQQAIQFWDGPVQPEEVRLGSPEWERYPLHNAANLYHVQIKLGLVTPEQTRAYRIAWVGGCVLYNTDQLRAVGGFGFWRELPASHCGEDVLAQQRVMARYGGCGLIPSGVYHQELPTTVTSREVNAPEVLSLYI